MNVRGNIPTKFSLGIFRGHFRQTSDPRNFLGSLFPRNSVGKFRGISEERRNSEELFPTTCFVGQNIHERQLIDKKRQQVDVKPRQLAQSSFTCYDFFPRGSTMFSSSSMLCSNA
ncbi:hypothetical protein DY000_02054911 [Brassica cretica]|uniref:Uncharacterized protein n=1 Tax=Brassica cretica TaxID=69181 RepID=A0ABQ7A6J8_BRACR|nr:hypothetical protein DY000_02054911 [Brassica cretica]